MPENEFEKQVQQKMDELNFAPSAVVWNEVEKQIAARKKRRVLIFWLPFLFLLLGGSGWIYFSGNKNNTDKKIITDQQKSSVAIKDEPTQQTKLNAVHSKKEINTEKNIQDKSITKAVKNNDVVSVEETDKSGTNKTDKNKNEQTYALGAGVSTNNTNRKNEAALNKSKSGLKKNHRAAIHFNANTLAANTRKNKSGINELNESTIDENDLAKNHTTIKKEENKKDVSRGKDYNQPDSTPVADTINKDTVIAAVKHTNKDSLKNVQPADSVASIAKNKSAAKKKKITWGINLNAGMSKISNGFSGLFAPVPSYNSSAFSTLGPGGLYNGASPFIYPSDIKPGFSFTTGIFISKAVGKNVNLTAALNYNYFSTSQQTGNKKNDSSTGQLQYGAGNLHTYTNRFHFVELPVEIEKQLSNTSRFSVNAGAVFSMLVGSNALQYDGQKNVYYKDNSRINKMQWGVVAGVHYRVLQKKLVVDIGPQLDYNFSNIYKKDLYGSRHALFAGIGTKIYLKKNKQ